MLGPENTTLQPVSADPGFNPCDDSTYLPSTTEFYNALGGGGIALYTVASVNTVGQLVFYLLLVKHFWSILEPSRLIPTLWVTSIYLVISSCNLVSLVLPKATDFLWLAYKIYVGIAMGYFVNLTLILYGGESAMINHVGEETALSFRKPPCCCCILLPKKSRLTKSKIRLMRGSVYQIPYTESLCLLLIISLQLSGYVKSGGLSFFSPYAYIQVLLSLSFFFGIWGLFMFFHITKKFDLLASHKYNQKSGLMKLTIVIINFQGMIIDICNKTGAISCMDGDLSASGVAYLIKVICVMIESFLLGCFNFYVYYTDGVTQL